MSKTTSVTLNDDLWEFVLDSLNDRLENLTDLNDWADYDFTNEIATCNVIMDNISLRMCES